MNQKDVSKHAQAVKKAWADLKAVEGRLDVPAAEVERLSDILVEAINAFQKEAKTPTPYVRALAS